jgi:transitional endoplasmic reticulum ATPase
MKAIANQYSIPFQEVTGSELLYAINAEGTLAIKGLWSMLRDIAPAILFISDIDSIASQKTLDEEEGKKALSIFLSMLDNIRPNDMIVIVGTSENPDALDPSLFTRGRFDKKISVPPPDINDRRRIFELNLADVPKIGDIDFDTLAKATDGYSGEDVFAVVEEAKMLALSKEDIFSDSFKGKKKPLGVKMSHLMNAVQKIKPSIKEWKERMKKASPEPDTQAPDVPASIAPQPPEKLPEKPPPPPPPPPFMLTDEDIAIMTISQLENECKRLGLKPYGKKVILQERLQNYLNEKER